MLAPSERMNAWMNNKAKNGGRQQGTKHTRQVVWDMCSMIQLSMSNCVSCDGWNTDDTSLVYLLLLLELEYATSSIRNIALYSCCNEWTEWEDWRFFFNTLVISSNNKGNETGFASGQISMTCPSWEMLIWNPLSRNQKTSLQQFHLEWIRWMCKKWHGGNHPTTPDLCSSEHTWNVDTKWFWQIRSPCDRPNVSLRGKNIPTSRNDTVVSSTGTNYRFRHQVEEQYILMNIVRMHSRVEGGRIVVIPSSMIVDPTTTRTQKHFQECVWLRGGNCSCHPLFVGSSLNSLVL